MEMNRRPRRSRGFMIAKLMPFCKAVKPPTIPSQDLYNNVHYTSSSSTTSYAPQPNFNNYITPFPHNSNVSFLPQPSLASNEDKDMDKKLNKLAEELIGGGTKGMDECVDARAASYISSVRERFKLDHWESASLNHGDCDHY